MFIGPILLEYRLNIPILRNNWWGLVTEVAVKPPHLQLKWIRKNVLGATKIQFLRQGRSTQKPSPS